MLLFSGVKNGNDGMDMAVKEISYDISVFQPRLMMSDDTFQSVCKILCVLSEKTKAMRLDMRDCRVTHLPGASHVD